MSATSAFVEARVQLAIGLEPADPVRGSRVAPPLLVLRETTVHAETRARLAREGGLLPDHYPAVRRAASCRFLALETEAPYDPLAPWTDVRLVEGRGFYGPRRFVPRRLRVPRVDPATAETEPAARRIRRPALYPGADYPIHETATALRGRVTRGGAAVRWARVEAYLPVAGVCPPSDPDPGAPGAIAIAHGDDRGEFLLLLPGAAAVFGGAASTTTLCIRVWAPAAAPVPADPALPRLDPCWDLPLEELGFLGTGDETAAGTRRPAGHTSTFARTLTLPLGRTTSDPDPFPIP